jgi:hypothetical protein
MDAMHAHEKSHLMSGGRYPVLKTIAILYLIGAGVMALAGLFAAIWALAAGSAPWVPVTVTPNITSRIMGFFAILGTTFLGVISMLAIAEGIKLFIDGANSLRIIARRNLSGAMPTAATVVAVEGAPVSTTTVISGDGKPGGRLAALENLDEETAEAALIRGH